MSGTAVSSPARRALAAAFAIAAAIAAFATSPARAQDEAVLRLRAVDQSAYYQLETNAGTAPPEPLLRDTAVRCMITPTAGTPTNLELRSDQDGMIDLPMASIPAGAKVSLMITPKGELPYLMPMMDPHATPRPTRAEFLRLIDESPMYAEFINITVTAQDLDKPSPYVRINVIARVGNGSPFLWAGERGAAQGTLLRLPVPAGMRVVAAKRGNDDLTCNVVTTASGQTEALLSGGFFAPAPAEVVRLVLTGPLADGSEYDMSYKTSFEVDKFRLNIEEGKFSFTPDPAAELALSDGGVNPPIQGVVTHGFEVENVLRGKLISARFAAGHWIHPRVWMTLGVIAFTALGAMLLGRAFATQKDRRASAREMPNESGPAELTPEEVEAQVRELDQRARRGEITAFELAARKALLQRTGPAPAKQEAAPNAAKLIHEIESRAGTADIDQLRADVRTLSAMLRETRRR